MPFDREYTTGEAAQRTGLSERQLRRYVLDGKLRSRRAGRATLFHADDVDALGLDLGRVTANRPGATTEDESLLASEIFQYLRERQEKLDAVLVEVGQLRSALETERKLQQNCESLRDMVADLKAEVNALQQEVRAFRDAQQP